MTEGRARAALVTGPVVVALAVLLAVGLLRPTLIDPGPGTAIYGWAVGAEGVAAVAALAVAAGRSRGTLRLSWAALAVMAAVWTVAVLGGLLGWDAGLVWGWLRAAVGVCGLAAMLLAPGVRRTAHEWGLVVFDGWLVGASVFVLGWVALAHTGSPFSAALTSATGRPALGWVPVDLLFASVVAGLAMRTERSTRTPVVLMVLVSLLVITGDTTWALTGLPYFPVVQWLIMMHALAGASTNHRLDLWQSALPAPASPRLLRWSQLAVVPGLTAAVASPGDPVVIAASLTVVLAMAGQIVLVSRQNQELWRALQAQARRLDQVVRDSRDAILQIDRCGVVEFANDAAAEVLGWPPATLVGRYVADLVHADDVPAAVAGLDRLGDVGASVRLSGRFRRQDGSWRFLEATVSRRSGADGLVVLARDVSAQMRLQSELRHLASTDPLTQLANRHHFLALLTERLEVGDAAVLFLDLDGFKQVNDTLGHAAGDRLLQDVAEALRSVVGPDDIAARLGGDEFAVLPATADVTAADALAVRIAGRLQGLGTPSGPRTSASVGVAVARGGTAEALLRDADLAMYEAKAVGGGRRAVAARTLTAPFRSAR